MTSSWTTVSVPQWPADPAARLTLARLDLAGRLAVAAAGEECSELPEGTVPVPRGCRAAVKRGVSMLGYPSGCAWVDRSVVPTVLRVAVREELRRERPADFVAWLLALADDAAVPLARLASEAREDRAQGCLTGHTKSAPAFARHLRDRHAHDSARYLYRLAVALAAHRSVAPS